jgi:hypothetical protein
VLDWSHEAMQAFREQDDGGKSSSSQWARLYTDRRRPSSRQLIEK